MCKIMKSNTSLPWNIILTSTMWTPSSAVEREIPAFDWYFLKVIRSIRVGFIFIPLRCEGKCAYDKSCDVLVNVYV